MRDAAPSVAPGLARVASVALALAFLWFLADPAMGASLDGPCEGTATIGGIPYDASYDTAENPIIVPPDRQGLRIPYEGSISVTNTNYLGAVGVVIGPVTVNVADWGLAENTDDIRATSPNSVYILGNELANVVGLYNVVAFHDADGGSCDADAMVKLEGPVLSTPVGAGATAGAALTGLALLAAGVPKARKP